MHEAVQGYQLSPELYARAVAYRRGEYWLYFATTAYTLLLLWALLHWRLAPKLRDWAERVSPRPWLQLLLFAPALLLIFGALLLPADTLNHWQMHRYGVSVQSWAAWLGDWSAGEGATLVAGALAIGLLYYLIRRSPHRWWLFLWMIAIPLFVLIAFIQPVAIDPLFNDVEPLAATHPDLVDAIEKLLARAHLELPRNHILLLKLGGKSTEVNASSEGFGPTKRIFVSDTIIAAEPGAALLHTLGHEIGHFMLTLDWIAFGIFVPLSLAIMYGIHCALDWAIARWGRAWGIRGAGDWASLPLLAMIVSLVAIALTPAQNTLSRYREHEADRFGLEVVHGVVPDAGAAAARAFQKHGELNLSDPDPPEFIRWWLFDHPPVNERIIFCRTYDPWSKREKPRYVR